MKYVLTEILKKRDLFNELYCCDVYFSFFFLFWWCLRLNSILLPSRKSKQSKWNYVTLTVNCWAKTAICILVVPFQCLPFCGTTKLINLNLFCVYGTVGGDSVFWVLNKTWVHFLLYFLRSLCNLKTHNQVKTWRLFTEDKIKPSVL